jgi:hypothetical protein
MLDMLFPGPIENKILFFLKNSYSILRNEFSQWSFSSPRFGSCEHPILHWLNLPKQPKALIPKYLIQKWKELITN